MIHIIIKVIVTALALVLVAKVVPGITVDSLYTALTAALVWGVLNIFVKPVLSILAFPITLITFGLFSFVLNAALFGLAAYLLAGFTVAGFLPALLGSSVVTMVSTIAYRVLT